MVHSHLHQPWHGSCSCSGASDTHLQTVPAAVLQQHKLHRHQLPCASHHGPATRTTKAVSPAGSRGWTGGALAWRITKAWNPHILSPTAAHAAAAIGRCAGSTQNCWFDAGRLPQYASPLHCWSVLRQRCWHAPIQLPSSAPNNIRRPQLRLAMMCSSPSKMLLAPNNQISCHCPMLGPQPCGELVTCADLHKRGKHMCTYHTLSCLLRQDSRLSGLPCQCQLQAALTHTARPATPAAGDYCSR